MSAISYLALHPGISGCSIDADVVTSLPSLQARITASSAPRSSARSGFALTVASLTSTALVPTSTSDIPRGSSATPVNLIVGLVVPAVIFSALAVSFCIWRRRRKSALKKSTVSKAIPESNSQPFFQQKPELHAEQARHEMAQDSIRYELDNHCGRNELLGEAVRNEMAASNCIQDDAAVWGTSALQELQGLDFSHELSCSTSVE